MLGVAGGDAGPTLGWLGTRLVAAQHYLHHDPARQNQTPHAAGSGSTTGDERLEMLERDGSTEAGSAGVKPGLPWYVRLHLHLAIASIPVLAISAHVLWSVSLRIVALAVLLPLLGAFAAVVVSRPHRSDRLLFAGFLWGLVACAGYDTFRLPTIYGFHWWTDFFGSVGGWATGGRSSLLVGYLWRYVGDGGGIAVAFFALAATLGAGAWRRRRVIALAVAYAIFPVWTGLIVTDLLAAHGHELFPLTPATLALSLGGHLIYGLLVGLGYWKSRHLEAFWPIRLPAPPERAAGRTILPHTVKAAKAARARILTPTVGDARPADGSANTQAC
jgi:hypothetical protein